jgi:hypothetical protein
MKEFGRVTGVRELSLGNQWGGRAGPAPYPAFDPPIMKGNGVMPSHSRNISEQEHSIKQRSHALFVEPAQTAEGTKPTKPFPVYLRETAAQPFSPLTKAIFWLLGLIVAALFLAALWRMSHRPKSNAKASRHSAKTAMLRDGDGSHHAFASPSRR